MKRLFPVAILVVLALLLLTQVGCDSDEETTSVDGPCGITVTRPLPGEIFLSGEEVKVFWSRSGSAELVKIDLLKAGEPVGEIASLEENDGYYFWPADVMEQDNGADFSVRVTALGEAGCADESARFSMTDINGCSFEFFTPPPVGEEPLVLVADGTNTYEITWFSASTTGRVNLELLHLADLVGVIATDVLDSNQSYTWNIDSLHEGTGSNYKIRIFDPKVSSCSTISPAFDLIDDEICLINIVAPQTGIEWLLGSTYDIVWNSQEIDGSLNIYLYYNGARILTIAENVDPALNSFAWQAFVPGGLPADNKALYQVRMEDNNNLYAPCEARTGAFLITD